MARLWTLRPLCFGEFPVFEKSVLTYNRNQGEKFVAPITGWLLQSEGEVILPSHDPAIFDRAVYPAA